MSHTAVIRTCVEQLERVPEPAAAAGRADDPDADGFQRAHRLCVPSWPMIFSQRPGMSSRVMSGVKPSDR